ncbi:hypothetical protein AgCh_038874 [Apium graveolens]
MIGSSGVGPIRQSEPANVFLVNDVSYSNNQIANGPMFVQSSAVSQDFNMNAGEQGSEGGNINRSLSTLGDVIYSLATKSPHIPFSPNENDLSETLRALNFASRVRGIELGSGKKQFDNTDLIRYKQLVKK